MRVLVVLGLLLLFFSALAFLGRTSSRRLLRLKNESRIWVRLIGILGILWVALVIVTDWKPNFVEVSPYARVVLLKIRHYVGGIVIGLFFALRTQDAERK